MKVEISFIKRKKGLPLRPDDSIQREVLEVKRFNECEVFKKDKDLYFSIDHFEALNFCTVVGHKRFKDISN